MQGIRPKFMVILLSGGLLWGIGGGGCLPANFFADLAGGVINTTVSAVVNELLNTLLTTGGAA